MPRFRSPDWLVAVGIALLACVLYGRQLEREPYNSDEGEWMTEGVETWRHVREGRFDDPFWSRYHLLYGFASPAIAKLLIGVGMSAAGHASVEDLGRPPALELGRPWMPPPGVLAAGRVSSVAMGALAVALLFAVLVADGSRRTAAWAALLLAGSPLWFGVARRAMTDVHGVTAALAIVPFFVAAGESGRRQGPARRLWRWALAGSVAGLAVGCKFSAAGAVAGLALVAAAGTRSAAVDALPRRRVFDGAFTALAFGVAAAGTFVATYPYLWPDPVGRFREILDLWREVRGLHAEVGLGAFGGSFRPGLRSIVVAARVLLVPGAVVGWSLLAVGVVALVVRIRRVSDPRATWIVWVAALPALAAGALLPGRTAQSWIAWAGLAGALGTAIAVPGALRSLAASRAGSALAALTAGALAFILATTYIGWARYYLPVLPGLVAFGAWGLVRLRGALAHLGGSVGARLLDASVVVGSLPVILAFPESAGARMGQLAPDVHGLASWAQRIALGLLILALVTAAVRGSRASAGD